MTYALFVKRNGKWSFIKFVTEPAKVTEFETTMTALLREKKIESYAICGI